MDSELPENPNECVNVWILGVVLALGVIVEEDILVKNKDDVVIDDILVSWNFLV